MTSTNEPEPSQGQMFLFSDHPASPTASPESVLAWMIRAATWPSQPFELLRDLNPVGSSSRMYPACFPAGPVKRTARFRREPNGTAKRIRILSPSSVSWMNSGILAHGVCSTLSTAEWRSGATACYLPDILETGEHLRQYCLSPKACAGILRRAAKRGKTLPEHLARVLRQVADSEPTST